MKIDLHLHSPSSIINGDSINWDSELSSIKKLLSNKIGAFAFTDHNVFSSKLYLTTKRTARNKIVVFPGVEASIFKDNGKVAHLLFIFNNNLEDGKLIGLEEICRSSLKKRGVKIDEVFELFKNYEFIAIPHVGKSDFFEVSELTFPHDAIETTSYTNSNYKKWIKEKNDKSIVAFSDTHIWRDYPQNKKLETRVPFDGTFKDLKEQLNMKKNYTEVK